MKKKLIITARVNEYKTRDENVNVPFSPDEIAKTAEECCEAGASIIHFHAREKNGEPCYSPEIYSEIISKIRDKCDILIDSTLGQITVANDEDRIAQVAKSKNKPDFAAVDAGSTNIDAYDHDTKKFLTENKLYKNTIETCLFLTDRMKKAGVRPHFTCWAIPFIRTVEAFLDMKFLDEPVYLQLAMAEGGIVGAHPGTISGLSAFAAFLPKDDGAYEWTALCKEGNLFAPAALAIELGGHVAPGIGDYAYPEMGYPTNAELISQFANLARNMGRHVANPTETRQMLNMK